MDSSTTITILHFNDVYNVDPRKCEPCGGAAKFAYAIKSYAPLNPLVLFSGDIFSPSVLSTFTKGEHMSQILNEVGTHCAVFGNHDFDFGLETLAERVAETKFPWLMSNVINNETGRPLGDGKITHVMDWNGKRIGLIGLVEEEWIDTIITLKTNDVTFLDFVNVAQKLCAQLKSEGCDFVIALTHMRFRNDKKLAAETTDIDLILGGHDHVYEVNKVNDKFIVKSGTDFRQFSKIEVHFQNPPVIDIEEVNVTKAIPEDANVKALMKKYEDTITVKMNKVLGFFTVPLEGRFNKLRTEETNLGNWICDILLTATNADFVAINSGTFRSDELHPPGEFTLGDLMRIIPRCLSTIVLINLTGETVWQLLENSVSTYPEFDGRFAQVAGLRFAFDPEAPAGKRVDPFLIRIRDEYLVMDKKYKLATKYFMHTGGDGYTMLPGQKTVIGKELCPELLQIIQNHLAAIKMRQGSHGLVPPPRLSRRANLNDLEHGSGLLAPTTDNRIVVLTPELKKELYLERKRLLANTSIIPKDEEFGSSSP